MLPNKPITQELKFPMGTVFEPRIYWGMNVHIYSAPFLGWDTLSINVIRTLHIGLEYNA